MTHSLLRRQARTLVRTATGAVRPAILAILLLLFAAGALLIVTFASNSADAALGLAVLAAVANFLLSMAIAPSCLMVQRSAWHARVPGLGGAAARVLLCFVLLTIVVPAAYVAITGAGDLAWTLMALSCTLVLCLVWLLLPILVAVLLSSLLGWIAREIVRFIPALNLGPQAAPESTLWLLGITLTLGAVVAMRWRHLIRKPQLSLSFNTSLLEKIAAMPDMLRASATNANATSSQIPAWLMPKLSRRLSATPSARLRTVLGPPFTPGYQRRMAAYCLAISAVLVVVSVQQVNVHHVDTQQLLARLGSQLLFGLIGGSCIAYAQRLTLIFRPQSGELAELALLPSLYQRAPARALVLAMLGAVSQTFAVLLALAVLAAASGLAGPGMRLALWWCGVVWLLQTAICVRHVSRGRRLIDNAGVSMLLSVFVLLVSLGAVAGLSALWNLWGAPGRILIVLAVLAGVAVLALSLRRWYRHAARLPQPFMIAVDRRTLSKEYA